jgi:hypothetical protein
MMAKAAEAAKAAAEGGKGPRPLLLGVTVLTSLKGADLEEVGLGPDVASQVLRLAGLAKAAGMDGVVCSPQEIESAGNGRDSPSSAGDRLSGRRPDQKRRDPGRGQAKSGLSPGGPSRARLANEAFLRSSASSIRAGVADGEIPPPIQPNTTVRMRPTMPDHV